MTTATSLILLPPEGLWVGAPTANADNRACCSRTGAWSALCAPRAPTVDDFEPLRSLSVSGCSAPDRQRRLRTLPCAEPLFPQRQPCLPFIAMVRPHAALHTPSGRGIG